MDAQGLLDVIEKRSQLDKAEDTEPAIGVVRFYVVAYGSWAAGVEGPFFDIFEVRYVVPAREFVLFL